MEQTHLGTYTTQATTSCHEGHVIVAQEVRDLSMVEYPLPFLNAEVLELERTRNVQSDWPSEIVCFANYIFISTF
jgi:hypothetical protein